jgi:hypothetical protein
LKELLGVVKEIMPGNPDESPAAMMMNTAEKFLPLLGEILTAQSRQPPAAPAQPAAPVLTAPAQPVTGANDMSLMLRMGINFLLTAAQNGEPAEDYVNIVLNKVPEEDLAQLIENPNYMQFLTQHVPECANFQPWFAELVRLLKEAFADEPAPGDGDHDLTNDKQTSTTAEISTGTAR